MEVLRSEITQLKEETRSPFFIVVGGGRWVEEEEKNKILQHQAAKLSDSNGKIGQKKGVCIEIVECESQ